MNRILLLVNPIAGRGRGDSVARRLAQRLRLEGFAVEVLTDGTQFPEPNQSQTTAVLVVGGDGTVRTAARWLLRHDNPADMPPILLVPLGTANLLARYLQIRWTDENMELLICAALHRRHIVSLDVARAGREPFLLMCGVGIDARIVHELARHRRGPISIASYFSPALQTLAGNPFSPISVTIDGHTAVRDTPAMAIVANVAEYGTGFAILPDARPDDGWLDVCVLPCDSRTRFLELFLAAAAGEHLQAEGVVYRRAHSVQIDSAASAGPTPVQVDGEPAGHTPVRIDLLPVRLPFIVPADHE